MKNINITRVILALLIIFVASIYLPELYWKITKEETSSISIFYSPIINNFLFASSDVRGAKYSDLDDNEYSRDEFEKLLPFMNYRQLVLSNQMPDSINGIQIDLEQLRLNNVRMRVKPQMINANTIPLNLLFESQSGRVSLELPPDFFRITDRMEFITSQTNALNEGKSELFTNALNKAGFSFPAKGIYGNPSTRKPFDEGYFVIDNSGKVFHIKMEKGQPFCKNINLPANVNTRFIQVNENNLKEFYGLLITENSEVYLITYDNYKLVQLPVEGYDYNKFSIRISANLFYRIITYYDTAGEIRTVVTDRNYKVVDTYEKGWDKENMSASYKIATFLFPFELTVQKSTTPMINLYFYSWGFSFLILSILLVVITFFYFKKKNVPVRDTIIYYLLVLFTGIYGFIAIISIKEFKNDSNI